MIKTSPTIFTTALLLTPAFIFGQPSFSEQWLLMQKNYKKMTATLPQQNNYYHSSWKERQKQIKTLILNAPNENFLHLPAIAGAMVRNGYTLFQKYEDTFILNCVSPTTRKLISSYRDTPFGLLPFECKEFNCSTSTLSHLFYAAKIIDNPNKPEINTILDFGGGYGNQTLIFKKLLPKTTLFIVDSPELIALQYLFLSSTLPDTKIYVHTEETDIFENGAIHLIPISLLEKLNLKIDLFISTFALSETPLLVQNLVINKNFFNASMCYMTGQLHGWSDFYFEGHETLLNSVRSLYSSTFCQPFHHMLVSSLSSYEIVGIRK